MKKLGILFTICVVAITANAQNSINKEPYLTKSFSSQAISNVISQTTGGNIRVSSVNDSKARVEVFASQNGNKEKLLSADEIKAKITNDYILDISLNNGKLSATSKPKKNMMNVKKSLSISFKIFVPQNVSTRLETSGGNIALTGLSGEQFFTTSGGNLDLNRLSGKIKGRTSGGNISLQNCKNDLDLFTSDGNIKALNSSGNILIKTSGGSIVMEKLSGNIKAETSGGNIKGNSINGSLTAQTSGGNISLLLLNCSLKTSTSGGNIDVEINNPGKYITIKNSSGKVNLTLPKNTGMDLKLSAMKISTENLGNFNGKNSKERIEGTVNGGGIPVTVSAGAGKIYVLFK